MQRKPCCVCVHGLHTMTVNKHAAALKKKLNKKDQKNPLLVEL